MSIHSLPRHAFPVLNESFLVDATYDYVKELGQGQSARRLDSTSAYGARRVRRRVLRQELRHRRVRCDQKSTAPPADPAHACR